MGIVLFGLSGSTTNAANRRLTAGGGLALLRNRHDTIPMMTKTKIPLLTAAILLSSFVCGQTAKAPSESPQYTGDGQLKLPESYREWVYLTTGFDMSYSAAMQMGHHMFDNVFVNPESYSTFVETGRWPDKTLLVLEARGAKDKGSINKSGHYQGTDVMGLEVHVKDEARFPGKWAFFGFGNGKTAKMVPLSADCYTCHAAHAAVDTTFVQFYPTLLPIAQSKNTLATSYQKENAIPAQK
jgi:hypothetical protein